MTEHGSPGFRAGAPSAHTGEFVYGARGLPIPFSGLLAISDDGSRVPAPGDRPGERCFRLGRSPWLEGAAAARLTAPLTILADFAVGAAVADIRPGPVVTESLRIDVLAAHSGELEMSAFSVAAAGRRHIARGVLRDRVTGHAVGHATGRMVELDGAVGLPSAPRSNRTVPVLSVREILDGNLDVVRPTRSYVRVRIPVGPDFGNSHGYMHGGAAAVMCDAGLHRLRQDVGGSLFETRIVDVSLDYYAPIPLVSDIEVTAAVTGRSRGRVRVRAEIGLGGGHPAVAARYTLSGGPRKTGMLPTVSCEA